jgi:hypothetical protein
MKKRGNKYAVHPEVAKIVGNLHTSLPREANEENLDQTMTPNLSKF